MSDSGDWLPEFVLLNDFGGDWQRYLDAVYGIFHQDFIASPPATFEGKRFALKRHPLEQGKEATFWHLISEGVVEAERLPDLRRCERIRWPRAFIEAEEHCVRKWRNKRGNDERIVLALDDFSYVVILADRGEYVLLWTAYTIGPEHRREKLRREYEAFQKG